VVDPYEFSELVVGADPLFLFLFRRMQLFFCHFLGESLTKSGHSSRLLVANARAMQI
jgi:hypothetical protein